MGEVFGGRYELIDLIGEGGMGAVWRARDLKLNRVVAAKVLRQSDASALLRFVREQGLRVNHPNVIAPLGWIGEDNQVLFTMRIVAGGSLATLIGDHGALPPRFAAEILRQLLAGLRAVHAAHLVHRDVKPANILLDATGSDRPHAYLTDFGIAVDLTGPRLTETGLVHGTPGYLAPELQNFGDVTPAVDMFAVGMVGAAMLTGARPRDLGIDTTTPTPEGVPESLWSLIRDLINPDAEARPGMAEALYRLEAPELAWREGAAEYVEVFQQLEPLDPANPHAASQGFEPSGTLLSPYVASFPTPSSPSFPQRTPTTDRLRQPTPPTGQLQQAHPGYAQFRHPRTPTALQSQPPVTPLHAQSPQSLPMLSHAESPAPRRKSRGKRHTSDWVLFAVSVVAFIAGVVLLVLWYVT